MYQAKIQKRLENREKRAHIQCLTEHYRKYQHTTQNCQWKSRKKLNWKWMGFIEQIKQNGMGEKEFHRIRIETLHFIRKIILTNINRLFCFLNFSVCTTTYGGLFCISYAVPYFCCQYYSVVIVFHFGRITLLWTEFPPLLHLSYFFGCFFWSFSLLLIAFFRFIYDHWANVCYIY